MTSQSVSALDLGAVGNTYPVKETDAIEEMKDRARSIDWGNAITKGNREERIREYRPGDLAALPAATKDDLRSVNMDYTLEFDVTDDKGNVIYPRGFTFNPLDYMTYDKTLVVLNGADKNQVAWFRSSRYFKDNNVKLLITGGSYYELSQELARPVFYASSKIVERLQLRAVPSVVRQKGRSMEVAEIAFSKVSK
jgi:conjugal transfer pilus assembly protein TraW